MREIHVTPLLDEFVCFQIGIKDFWLEFFYYSSEKLPLSQNLATSEGAISHVLYYQHDQQLSNVRYQVSFKVIFVLSNYQTCTFPLNGVTILILYN